MFRRFLTAAALVIGFCYAAYVLAVLLAAAGALWFVWMVVIEPEYLKTTLVVVPFKLILLGGSVAWVLGGVLRAFIFR